MKARHFVLALRDYYRSGEEMAMRATEQDEWALEYINDNTMQAIVEAFDDDASGFITVAEVNHFTASRPIEWR